MKKRRTRKKKKQNKSLFLIGLPGLVILVGLGIFLLLPTNQEITELSDREAQPNIQIAQAMDSQQPRSDSAKNNLGEQQKEEVRKLLFEKSATLFDVTQRKQIHTVQTKGRATGVASMRFENGEFALFAKFSELPTPQGDDYYEAWLVREQSFSYVSLGPLEKLQSTYKLTYSSGLDLSQYTFFVLTLEGNDGNRLPGEHILEGRLQPIEV